MEPSRQTRRALTHDIARLLYWISLALLLAGAWILINPYGRTTGETAQVYIAAIAFELYVWGLLAVGRWQARRGLAGDAARSGIFAAVLVGLLFMVVNELHMAAPQQAIWVAAAAAVLALVKLPIAARWLGFPLPAPLLAACAAWVFALAVPAAVIGRLAGDVAAPSAEARHVASYLACWFVALLVAGHLLLVAWQASRGWQSDGRPLGHWGAPWILSGILGALAVLQLFAMNQAYFVHWAQWYFSPIWLGVGAVAVSLSHARGRRRRLAWFVMVLAVAHASLVWPEAAPSDLPATWRSGIGAYIVHPIIPSGVFVSLLLALTGLLLRRAWWFVLASAAPGIAACTKAVQALLRLRHGKGLSLLAGAFVLLGAAAGLQWWRERRQLASLRHHG